MAPLGSSEFGLRDMDGGGTETRHLESLLGVLPRQHPISVSLPPVCRAGGSVEVDAADCFVSTESSRCTRAGTLMASSIKHQSSLLKSEHSDTHGVDSVCVVLTSSLD